MDIVHKDLHGHHPQYQQQQSIGIDLKTTMDLGRTNQPACLHHTISRINPMGPVGARGVLKIDDELLEVNGRIVRGSERDEALAIVQDTPTVVRLVVCRPAPDETDEPALAELKGEEEVLEPKNGLTADLNGINGGPDITLASCNDSDDDRTPQDDGEDFGTFQSGRPSLPAIDYLVGDFTRRFERQSWRERHEEERTRLKQKFEVRKNDV